MIKTILFDADGVLITNKRKFSDHLADDLNITREMTDPFYKGPFKDCLVGKADLKVEIAPFLPRWGWKGSVDDFLKLWFEVEHKLDTELLAHIQKLRIEGIKCYIATNQEKYRAQYMKEYMEFGPMFDGLFASDHIGYCKPDPKFFSHILNTLHIKPHETAFWDDTQQNVDAAKELGIQAKLYTTYENFITYMNQTFTG